MISRALKLYGFVFIYGLIIMGALVVPQLFAAWSYITILIGPADSAQASLFEYSLIMVLITWVVVGCFAMVSWIIFQKMHVLSLVLAVVLLVAFVGLYVAHSMPVEVVSFLTIAYATMLIDVVMIVGWLAKQFFDVRSRMLVISVAGLGERGLGVRAKIWGMALCLFIISVVVNILYSVWPVLIGLYLVDDEQTMHLLDIFLAPSLWVTSFLCFLLSIYFGITLMRKRQLQMVHFTRISIVTSLTIFLMIAVGFGVRLIMEMPMEIILTIISSATPAIISAICGVSLGLSLAFWLVMKIFSKTKSAIEPEMAQ